MTTEKPNYLLTGVRQELNGTFWTTQNEVTLQVKKISDPIVHITIIPFINEPITYQKLSIHINSTIYRELKLEENKPTVISIPLFEDSSRTATMLLPNATVPKSIGLSEDEDKLGLLITSIEIESCDKIVDELYDKISWAFRTQKQIKDACKKIATTKNFYTSLPTNAQNKIKHISELENFSIEYFNRKEIRKIAIQHDIINTVKEWASQIHIFSEEFLAANNYLTYKHQLASYQPTDKLRKYSSLSFYSGDIDHVRKNNLELNSREILNHSIKLDSTPPYMFFSIINVCNLQCVMCYQSQIDFYKHLMDDDVLIKIFEYLPYSHYISISGLGEPTLAPNFDFFAKISNHLRCHTGLITNGMTLDKKQEYISLMTEIAISFDAGKQETFESLRNKAKFDKIRSNIKNIKKNYPSANLAFSTTISRLSLPEMSRIIKLAHKLKISTVNINAIYNSAGLELETSDRTTFIAEEKKAKKLAEKYGIKLFSHITEEHFAKEGKNKSRKEILIDLKNTEPVLRHKFDIDKFSVFLKKNDYPNLPFAWRKKETASTEATSDNVLKNKWEGIIAEQKKSINKIKNTFKNTPYCLNPWNLLFVKEDGTVRLCCNSDRYMGDMNTHSIKEIYNNELFQTVRKSMLGLCEMPPECVTCKAGNRHLGNENLTKLNNEPEK